MATGTFTSGGNQTGGTLSHNGVPVTVTNSGNVYTGTAGGVTVFTMTIRANGTYRFVQNEQLDHSLTNNNNEGITLDFGVKATDSDGDVGTGVVTITVLDDAPNAVNDGNRALEEGASVTGNIRTNDDQGEDSPATIMKVTIGGVDTQLPTDGSNVAITTPNGVLTINNTGAYTYEASNNGAGNDRFTYTLKDGDGDTDTATFGFNVTDVVNPPIITTPPTETVDDTNLDSGNNVVTGTINVDYDGRGPGSIDPNGTFSSSVGNLTHCDEDIIVTSNGNNYFGRLADGTNVFRLNLQDDGSYTFTQYEAIDHPNTVNPNDVVTLNFGATATNADGDTSTTTLKVRVLDDGPEIQSIFQEVDEDTIANGTLVANGTVPHDFGQDGAGEITATGLFEAKFQRDGSDVTLTSAGRSITVTNTANGYVGRAGNETIFTFTVDPATGEYVYNQFQEIDHPDANDPDDIIWLKFFVQIEDKDGDVASAPIVIDVHDDAPRAVNDTDSLARADQTARGNVLTNDDIGVDNGPDVAVTTTGTFNGTFGRLVLNADGSYIYTRNGDAGGVDTFNYTMRDHDGDTSSATLTFTVGENNRPISVGGSGQTDDTDVNNGTDVATGNINVNYQGDGPGTTMARDTFSSTGNLTGGTLSSNGVPVNVTLSGNTFTGTAGGVTVFTMTINANGTYRFVQNEALDHSNTNSANEAITLNFGVKATDSDGDVGNGLVRITVLDDGPVATDDVLTAAQDGVGNMLQRDLLANDSFGDDGAGNAKLVSFNGQQFVNGVVTFSNDHVTMTVTQDGMFKATLIAGAPVVNFRAYSYDYVIQDADGDRSTATVSYTVTPLVLDLDGDGLEFTSTENGVLFDYDIDGELEQTAWVDADDGFLVQDRNDDGIINDRGEMFGDLDGHADGFAHLASLDSNNDGEITADDAEWSTLQVWQDLNQDGVSDANELFGLDDLGIASINVGNTTVETDRTDGDVFISRSSTYTTTDGVTREIVDAHFNSEEVDGLDYYADVASDETLFAAITEAAADVQTQDVLNSGQEAGDLYFDDGSEIDNAIQDFVYSTTAEDTLGNPATAQNGDSAQAAPLAETAGAAGFLGEEVKTETIV
jgi:T1SS-143 domain-containing protein